MGLFDKFKGWLGFSEAEKIQMDRRAFLKGMAVTSAGVLLPGAAVFDMARAAPAVLLPAQAEIWPKGVIVSVNGIVQQEGSDYTVDHDMGMFQINPQSGLLLPHDLVTIEYTAKLEPDKSIRIIDEQTTGASNTERRFVSSYTDMHSETQPWR